MRHPLEFVPHPYRKKIFFTLLFPTLILLGIFSVLDQPLRTPAAPYGIVSFELARTPEQAGNIMISWSRVRFQIRTGAYPFAVFGLGLDYLFMPLYASTLAFGTLFAANRHGDWLRSLGAVAGYGAFIAAVFDVVENYALFQVLLGKVFSPYPEIAFYCASVKFGLLIFGLIYYASVSGLLPKKWRRIKSCATRFAF